MANHRLDTGAPAGFRALSGRPRNDRIHYTYVFLDGLGESDEMQISVTELQNSRTVSSPDRYGGFC